MRKGFESERPRRVFVGYSSSGGGRGLPEAIELSAFFQMLNRAADDFTTDLPQCVALGINDDAG
jgi:hypothetical protein